MDNFPICTQIYTTNQIDWVDHIISFAKPKRYLKFIDVITDINNQQKINSDLLRNKYQLKKLIYETIEFAFFNQIKYALDKKFIQNQPTQQKQHINLRFLDCLHKLVHIDKCQLKPNMDEGESDKYKFSKWLHNFLTKITDLANFYSNKINTDTNYALYDCSTSMPMSIKKKYFWPCLKNIKKDCYENTLEHFMFVCQRRPIREYVFRNTGIYEVASIKKYGTAKISKSILKRIGSTCINKIPYQYIPNGATISCVINCQNKRMQLIKHQIKQNLIYICGYKQFNRSETSIDYFVTAYDVVFSQAQRDIYQNLPSMRDKKEFTEYVTNTKLKKLTGLVWPNCIHSEPIALINLYKDIKIKLRDLAKPASNIKAILSIDIYIDSYKNCCWRCLNLISEFRNNLTKLLANINVHHQLIGSHFYCTVFAIGHRICGDEEKINSIITKQYPYPINQNKFNNVVCVVRSNKK